MTTQPDHGHELIPRPERTPDAVRVALAVVHSTSSREDPAFRPAMDELRAVEADAERAVSA
ncbi:hypothetical protein OK074_8851 [Actinobacteria bacterium OK074]|nr:hypothetical protein OK074_8851 [Actinobacteria bacterium OK074]